MTEPILSPAQFQEILPQGHIATVTRVPSGLDMQDALRGSYDDRSIDVAKTMGSIWFYVKDGASDAMVATAVFAADELVVRCDTVEVKPAYQKSGVARAIYQIASREFVAPVVPSAVLSPDAVRFWGVKTQIIWP